jgi:hypothetical protein
MVQEGAESRIKRLKGKELTNPFSGKRDNVSPKK